MSTQQPRRAVRSCSRAGCRNVAVRTLTYIYADSTAVLGPLATYAEPHAYDLCEPHSEKMTVPMGWTVLQHKEHQTTGPSEDDLMAIADAIREVGRADSESADVGSHSKRDKSANQGRRGHLRVLPS